MANKHGITAILTYNPTHLNVEPHYHGAGWCHLLHHIAHAAFQLWGQSEVDLVGILTYQSMSALSHLEKTITSGSLGVTAFNDPWTHKVSYFLLLHNPCFWQNISQVISAFNSSSTMSDRSSLASHSTQHARRHSSLVTYCKGSLCGCFSRPCAQGSAIAAFNTLADQRCV